MLFDEFTKALRQNPQPAYSINGSDDYWAIKAYRVVTALCDPTDLSEFGPQDSVRDALSALDNFPMFGEVRVVVIRDVASFSKEEKEALESYCADPSPTSILVLFRCGWTPAGAVNYKFEHATPAALAAYWKEQCAQNGVAVEDGALSLLAEYCGADATVMEGELMKLQNYCAHSTIDAAAVRAVVTPNENYRVYAFSDQVSRGNYVGAYKVLDSLAGSSSDYVAFLGLLINHYRRMFYSKICSYPPAELGKMLGNQKETAIAMAAKTARQYTPKALLGLLQCLYRLEYEFKSGQTTVEQALAVAVAEAIERRTY